MNNGFSNILNFNVIPYILYVLIPEIKTVPVYVYEGKEKIDCQEWSAYRLIKGKTIILFLTKAVELSNSFTICVWPQ